MAMKHIFLVTDAFKIDIKLHNVTVNINVWLALHICGALLGTNSSQPTDSNSSSWCSFFAWVAGSDLYNAHLEEKKKKVNQSQYLFKVTESSTLKVTKNTFYGCLELCFHLQITDALTRNMELVWKCYATLNRQTEWGNMEERGETIAGQNVNTTVK